MAQSPVAHDQHHEHKGCPEGMQGTTHLSLRVLGIPRENPPDISVIMSVIQSLAHCCSLRLEFTLKLCVNNKLKRMSALETPGQSQTKEWEGTEGITLQAPEPSKILSCLVFLMFLPCYCSNHPNSGFHWIQIVGHASLARLRTHHHQSCWRLPKSRGYPQIIHFNRF